MNINEMIKYIVKNAIESKLFNKPFITKFDVVKEFPEFVLKKATFVTLKIDGRLRGCIGSLVAHRELYDDLANNAYSAAFKDPRFKPLTKEEFEKIDIEVSLLSDAKLLKYEDLEDLKSKIRVGIDGVILKKNQNQATFLPQVWEELKDFETFFSHLSKKAGLDYSVMSQNPEIYTYEVQKIK